MEREGLIHTVCACVNFMNAHVMKIVGVFTETA